MNILYTFLNFNGFTGSEMYYYELSREMVNRGHAVTIVSNCGGEMKFKAMKNGVRCLNFHECGDLNKYDIIHTSHKPVVKGLIDSKVKKPVVCTIHSEVLDIEAIDHHDIIKHYITIRSSIKAPIDQSTLIYNPIDVSRFNKNNTGLEKYIFFPGSINYLRTSPLMDVFKEVVSKSDLPLVVMGRNDYPDFKIEGALYLDPVFNVEHYIKDAAMVVGILKGRTYMESVFCGKPYMDYNVDLMGNILGINTYAPGDYLSFGKNIYVHKSEFDSKNVAEKIEGIYKLYI